MALVKCPECGREKVSDSAEACPDCGYGIKVHYEKLRYEEEQKIIEEKRQKEKLAELVKQKENEEKQCVEKEQKWQVKKKKVISLIISCVTISVIVVIVKMIILPAYNYNKAMQLMNIENYQEAELVFQDLRGYRDSSIHLEVCKLEIIKRNIDNGDNLTEALQYLNSIEASKENTYIKVECLWKLAQNSYSKKEYLQTIRYLDEIGGLDNLFEDEQEAFEILEDCLYNYAMERYEIGDFNSAIVYFERIDKKNETINSYIEKSDFMLKIQGKWNCSEQGEAFEISGWTMEKIVYVYPDANETINLKNFEIRENEMIEFLSDTNPNEQMHYDISNGKLRMYMTGLTKYTNMNYHYWYYEKTDTIPEPKKEPCIGMTAEEVKASTWGEPEDINKSTYSWGVKEQWCYSGYRYIYLEDGIVTSISE